MSMTRPAAVAAVRGALLASCGLLLSSVTFAASHARHHAPSRKHTATAKHSVHTKPSTRVSHASRSAHSARSKRSQGTPHVMLASHLDRNSHDSRSEARNQLASRHIAVSAARAVLAHPAAAAIPGEIRAMWIVRDSLTNPAKIHNAVAMAKRYHFNTLFVQVRGRGDAYYNSHVEPRAEELSGQPTDFDPLAVAIDEGHKAGLEVHAWLDTFFVWHRPRRPYAPEHVINLHPEWLVRNREGHTTLTEIHDCEGAFLDPGIPEVREYTKRVFLDLVENYPVDGIHFDYVRFPSDEWSFSDADMTYFREWALPQVPADKAAYADARVAAGSKQAWFYCFRDEWKQWRRSVVTDTVKSIADEAHRMKPGIIISAAVFPNYHVASQDKGQPWHDWLKAGILDAACPMTYNTHTETVGAQVRDALENSSGKPIVAGVGAWQMPARSAVAKAKVYRALGASGINFFCYGDITRDGRSEAYLAEVGRTLFSTPATPPNWRRAVTVAADSVAAQSGVSTGTESGGQ